jgi:hypothetical protein
MNDTTAMVKFGSSEMKQGNVAMLENISAIEARDWVPGEALSQSHFSLPTLHTSRTSAFAFFATKISSKS